MSEEKMRDEFDSWIEQQGMNTMKDGETYYHHVTHAAWQAWKASRAAPAVQGEPVAWYLPNEEGYDSMFRDHATVKACTDNPWAGWQPLYTAPQPAEQQPDATQLVEALEAALMVMTSKEVRLEKQADAITMARAALAAHRKQGGEV